MATTEAIISGGGGDYTTIQGWADNYASTTLTDRQIGEIQDNSTYDEHVTFTGITSTAALNMVLSVASANRPKGILGGGCKLHPTDAGHAVNSSNNDHFVVEHLEIHTGTAASDECLRATIDNVTIQYCLCVGRGKNASPFQQDGLHTNNMAGVNVITLNVYNCFFQDFSRAGITTLIDGGGHTHHINAKNCTAIHNGNNTGAAIDQIQTGAIGLTVLGGSSSINVNADNFLAIENVDETSSDNPGDFCEHNITGTINYSGSGNIAGDGTATEFFTSTNNLDNAVLTTDTTPGVGVWVVLTNLTAGSEDLHIQSSNENEAENANSSITFADTTALFTDDIDGDTRTAALMDGGADQISFAGGGGSGSAPFLGRFRRKRRR